MKAEELTQIAVLREMEPESLAALAAILEEKEYAEGQTIFAEGEPGDSMYFILTGRVRVEKRTQAGVGTTKVLTVLDAGDYFGEMSLFDQKPRSAAAVAGGSARVLRLSKAAFDELQRTGKTVGMTVLFAMIRTSSERIRRLSTQLVVYDEVGKAIGEAPDLPSLLAVILQQLMSATQADWGLLLLRSQFSERLEIRSEANLSLSPAQREAIMNGEGFLGVVQRSPEFLVVPSFSDEAAFRSCARLGFETTSLLVAPIVVSGQLLGLVALGDQEKDQFTSDALNLSRGVARQAGQAILNARYREEEQARSRHSRQYVKF
jgi:CRP/FNR family cyclic AMP-dependent transcriptional regulator